MKVAGARVLVTGASGGLGAAIARAAAAGGAQLVVTGRNDENLRRLAADIKADFLVADLTDPSEVARLIEWAGEIDVLVSNAALPAAGQVQTFSAGEIDRTLSVNLRAPMILSLQFGQGMSRRGRGHIVFVSSLAAAFPTPGLTVYNATKNALASYALSLRGELAAYGVGVSVIYPGPIREAGMWADTGLSARGLRTKSPAEVGDAVIRAVEHDLAQVSVASATLRIAAAMARAAPGVFARIAPGLGASKFTGAMADALRHKR